MSSSPLPHSEQNSDTPKNASKGDSKGDSKETIKGLSVQSIILRLMNFWDTKGCVLAPTYDMEMGAGTSHPLTALYALGPRPWRVAFVQPSRRPGDGRYGDNPNRVQKFHQFQVLLKPAPDNPQELLLESYDMLGMDTQRHDIRFIQDDWENPSLGAAGLGWEVWYDGMEITQFTYFQQMGGLACNPVSVELAYGIERIALCLQEKQSFWDLRWNDAGVTYKDLIENSEREFCQWYFQETCPKTLQEGFHRALTEGHGLIEKGLIFPAYECCIKSNHLFNMLDARSQTGPAQRAEYIGYIRALAGACARAWQEVEINRFSLMSQPKHASQI